MRFRPSPVYRSCLSDHVVPDIADVGVEITGLMIARKRIVNLV